MAQPFWFKTHAPGRYTVRLREGDVYLGEIEKRGERAWVLEDGRSFPSRRGAAEALRLKLEADPGLPIIQITPAATMVGLEDEPAQIEDEPADEPAQIEDEPADEPAQAEDEPIEAIWAELEQRFQSETPIEGTIIARIRGGYSVDIGVRGFLPASQLQVRASRPSDKPIGQRLEFRIIKLNAARKNVVLSRRVLLESAQQESRAQLLTRFQEGDIVEGTVNKIMRYGAFIDLGGIDGLLHITDMREGWVSHPAKVVEVGQRLKVKILKIDAEAERISLGLKQLQQIEEDLALAGQPGNEESTPHDHANEAPLAAAVALEAGDARDADAGESAASGSDQAVVLATLTEPVAEPVEAVAEPVEAVAEPVEAVIEPVEAVAEPVEAVIEPVEAVAEPVEAVIEPVEAVAEPVEAVAEPVEAVIEPVEAVAEPVEAVAEPVEAVAEPVEAVAEPVEAVAEPVEAVAEPVEAVAEPVEAVAEPAEAVAEPVEAVAKPVEAVAEPVEAEAIAVAPRAIPFQPEGRDRLTLTPVGGDALLVDWEITHRRVSITRERLESKEATLTLRVHLLLPGERGGRHVDIPLHRWLGRAQLKIAVEGAHVIATIGYKTPDLFANMIYARPTRLNPTRHGEAPVRFHQGASPRAATPPPAVFEARWREKTQPAAQVNTTLLLEFKARSNASLAEMPTQEPQ